MKILDCQYISVPLSVTLAGSKEKDKPLQLRTSFTAEAAGRKCRVRVIYLKGSTQDLFSRFTPETFLEIRYGHKVEVLFSS